MLFVREALVVDFPHWQVAGQDDASTPFQLERYDVSYHARPPLAHLVQHHLLQLGAAPVFQKGSP